ncbi:MAG: efflux RND transporter periplasmic adaptor subunit [Gammaproteobacteria bacterium]
MFDEMYESINWRKHRWQWIGIAVVILVVVIFTVRIFAYWRLKGNTLASSVPLVRTITAQNSTATEKIYLPGFVMPWHGATVYARAKGYLKFWYVDIGYHVRKGDVLAVIDRPELDAQLHEAESYLNYATAQNDLAQITAKRWVNLLKTDSVSKQATDDKTYGAASLAATMFQARANFNKLRAFVNFETVVAPFDGVISSRQTDIGDLINIGSNPAEAQPLFQIVQSDKLRLYVNVPQTYSTKITPNMTVYLRFAEHPGRVFTGKLLKTAENIDASLQTLQAEFWVDNRDGVLFPGGYTMVEIPIEHPQASVILPVNTLIFQAAGLQIATVDDTGHVVFKNIDIATDFGKKVRVEHGIQPGEHIIINPPDSLYAGQRVDRVDANIQTEL